MEEKNKAAGLSLVQEDQQRAVQRKDRRNKRYWGSAVEDKGKVNTPPTSTHPLN